MATIFDIVPLTETVSVNGQDVTVGAANIGILIPMLLRFPEIGDFVEMKTDDNGATSLSFIGIERLPDVLAKALVSGGLLTLGAGAVAAVIASGLGYSGDRKAETQIGRFPFESQVDLLEAVLRCSMPNGPGPFVDKIKALIAKYLPAQEAAAAAPVPENSSPAPSTISEPMAVSA